MLQDVSVKFVHFRAEINKMVIIIVKLQGYFIYTPRYFSTCIEKFGDKINIGIENMRVSIVEKVLNI